MLQKVEICGVDTSGLPLLTAEDNERLMKQIKEGDEKAREEFIVGNMRLVLSLVKRFWAKNANADDVFVTSLLDLPCNVFVSKFDHNADVSISVDIADI